MLLVFAVPLVVPRGASAEEQERSQVALALEGCETLLTQAALDEALNIELRAADPAVRAYVARVNPGARLRCDADLLQLELTSDDGLEVRETLQPTRGIARFLALSITEALAARALAPPLPPPEGASPAPVAAVVAPLVATSVAVDRMQLAWRLRVLGGARAGGTPVWWSADAAVAAALSIDGRWVLEIGLIAAHGVTRSASGDIHASLGALALGGRYALALDVLRIELGAGARAGAVRWGGVSEQDAVVGRTAVAPWLAATASGVLALPLGSLISAELEGELGAPLWSSRAAKGAHVLARLGPGWLALRAGLAFDLDAR